VIQAAVGDLYRVSGNFLSAGTQNTTWNTTGAGLEFITGAGTSHIMQLTGSDVGSNFGGCQNNFAWGVLTVHSGDTLTLEGGLGSSGPVAL
jgi:hypothetical protein